MADITQYDITIKFSETGAEKTAKDVDKIQKSTEKLKSTIKGLGIAAVLKKSIDAIGSFINKTSDYIETVNLFRASMGQAADAAQKFINRAESDLGLDPKVLMDSVSQFYNMADSLGISSDRAYLMSQNMTQLAADLSSFANISVEAAQSKLMSGLSGQVKPLREYGIAIDQASLQETAYSLGIQQRVKDMTRAQKTELIYYQIMTQTTKMQGDLGRSMISPANALRIMKAEFQKLARAVGSIFIPIMMKIIPVIRAVTQIITEAAQKLAKFFGFEISNYNADLSSVGNLLQDVGGGIEDVGDAADDTAGKLNKMLMPFDELNNITSNLGSAGSGLSGIGGGGDLGIDLPQYDMFDSIAGDMTEKIEKIKEKIKAILPFVQAIGIALGAWKISNKIVDTIGTLFNWSKDTKSGVVQLIMGVVLLIEGIKMVVGSITKMINGDLTIGTLLEGIFGSILGGAGAAMITGTLLGGPGVGIAIGMVLLLTVLLTWAFQKDKDMYTKIAAAQGLEYKDMSFWDKSILRINTTLEVLGIKQGDENTEWGKAVNSWQDSTVGAATGGVFFNASILNRDKELFLEKLSKFFTEELPQWLGKNITQSFIDMWKFVEWSNLDFKTRMGKFFSLLAESFKWENVKERFTTIMDLVSGILDKIKQTFEDDWDRIKKIGISIVEGIGEGFSEDWERFKTVVSTLWDNFIAGVKEKLGIHSPSTVFKEIGENLIRGFTSGIEGMWGTLTDKFDNIKNLVNFNWHLPSLTMPHMYWSSQPAPEWAAKLLKAINLPTNLPKLNISWYAQGGFPEAGQLFIANEAGPELVGNIGNKTAVANKDQITTAIANATYEAVSRALSENSNDSQPIIVNVGNEQLYKGFTKYQNQQSRMYGINV